MNERIAVAANTALVKIAQRLEESERWLRTIADNVPAHIVYVDGERRYQFCNRAFEVFHELAPGEALGRAIEDVHGERTWKHVEPFVAAAFEGRGSTFDVEHPTSTGVRYLRASFVPDWDAEGRVMGLHGLIHDVTESRRQEAELERLARYDPLTELPNRALFNDRLGHAQARAEREGKPMALLYLDLDRFKSINDTLGHGAGDEVLREFARRLTACVRRTDTVARIAGDEFVVILEGLNEEDEAAQVAAKILAAMNAPVIASGCQLDVRASIGIALQSGPATDSDVLIARADAALYEAKRSGRNSFRVSTSMPQDTQPRPLRRARLSATSNSTSPSSNA